MKIQVISGGTVGVFAAEELKKYLRMMMPYAGEVAIELGAGEGGFRLGLMPDFGLSVAEAEDPKLDDIVHIDCDAEGGIIAGSNPRSILLAVYQYLRENGCRFLFPGVDGEYIPMQAVVPVKYHKMADMRYRGQCNEGAESQQAMLDTIDFTPKLGMNVYMMEFTVPKTYYDGYYNHVGNPTREAETVSEAQVLQWKRQCEAEIAKRGLQFHDMGHGWTAEPFGISSLKGWGKSTEADSVPEDMVQYLAMLDGKRGLCRGVALNTNVCMSNPRARRIITEAVVDYARKCTNVDYLHVWLADWKNNHCECEACRAQIPSDWYVVLLNELDEALTAAGLETKIGAIIYSDTAWAPEKQRVKNPSRFVFLLGAITRSYTYSVEKDPVVKPTPYIRNKSGRLSTMEEYVMQAHGWQKMGATKLSAYEYHFWKAISYAPGVLSFARRLYEDIRSYKANGFEGIIEDGSQRAFFPNALGYTVYGRSLFDMSLSLEELEEDYLRYAYGEAAPAVKHFLERIEETLSQKFCESIHSEPVKLAHYHDKTMIPKLEQVDGICRELEEAVAPYRTSEFRVQTVAVRLLGCYTEYLRALAQGFILKAQGKDAEAKAYMTAFWKTFGAKEQSIERYYDQANTRKAWDPIFSSMEQLDQ